MPTCRVCLSDANTLRNPLIDPCYCRGTSEHIHAECLWRWEILKLRRNYGMQFRCEVCLCHYNVLKQKAPIYLKLLLLLQFLGQILADSLGHILFFLLIIKYIVGWIRGSYAQHYYNMHFDLSNFLLKLVFNYLELLSFEELLTLLLSKYTDSLASYAQLHYGENAAEFSLENVLERTFLAPRLGVLLRCMVYPSISQYIGLYLFPQIENNLCHILLGGILYILYKNAYKLFLIIIIFKHEVQIIFLPQESRLERMYAHFGFYPIHSNL